MRQRPRKDSNHQEIVDALELAGATILDMAGLGRGAPDLGVGLRGQNFFLEIKDSLKSPSRRRLTRDEKVFHQTWRGQIDTVSTKEEALKAVGLL